MAKQRVFNRAGGVSGGGLRKGGSPGPSPLTQRDPSKWEVVMWESGARCHRREFDTKEAAYLYANSPAVDAAAVAIEVYGPDGEYDAV